MKKTTIKSTSQKKLDQYIADAKKRLKRGEVSSITDKTQLTTEDKIKMSLCKLFVQYLNRNNMKPSEFSKLTKIEKTRVSEIINYKVKKFKIDQLVKNLEILSTFSPEVKQHLAYLEQAMDLPVIKVVKSKQLTNSIKKISHKTGYSMAY